MGLTIRYDTLPMTPVRNRAWMEVTCDGHEQQAATVAQVDLQVTDQPSPGYTITIALPDGSVTELVAVTTTPDDSGTQYLIGASELDTYANLLAALGTNPYLVLWYELSTVGIAKVRFTARQAGANTPVITFPDPPPVILTVVTEGTDAVTAPAYSANCRIYLERSWQSGVYEALPAVEAWPDDNEQARWDLARMLKPYVEKHVAEDWPAYGMDDPAVAQHIVKRYYVDRWERYGDPPKDRKTARSGVKYAWYAGTRNRDVDTANELGAILRYDLVATPWMTYRGRRTSKHEVSAAQQHVLGWYRSRDVVEGEPIRMRVVVYYTDGTNEAVIGHVFTGAEHIKGSVSLWPCGFDTLGLGALQPTKTPYKYTVVLRNDAATEISETHTFWLRPTEVSELHLECINSLGVVESFRAVGRWAETLEPEREDLATLRTVLDGDLPSISESDTTQLLVGVTPLLEVSMGHVDRLEHQARMDILFSPQLRLVDHGTGRKLPVRLVPDSVQVRERGAGTAEHLYGMTLQLVAGDAEMAWGERALLPAFTPGAPGVPQPGE